MQISAFVLDMIYDYPTKWSNATTKLIGLLWSVTFAIYWLSALRFPTKFIYFLPVVLIIINTMSLASYVDSIKKDVGDLWPEVILKEIERSFIV